MDERAKLDVWKEKDTINKEKDNKETIKEKKSKGKTKDKHDWVEVNRHSTTNVLSYNQLESDGRGASIPTMPWSEFKRLANNCSIKVTI